MKYSSLVLVGCILAGILALSPSTSATSGPFENRQVENYASWTSSTGEWVAIENLTFTLDSRCAVVINSDGDVGDNLGFLNTRLLLDGAVVAGENMNIAVAPSMGGFYVGVSNSWTNITTFPNWRSIQNVLSVSTDTILTRTFMPAMTIRKFIASVTVNSSPSGSYDVTLCKNGVATALTVNIPFGVTGAIISTADVVVVQGDYLSYNLTKNGAPASGTVTAMFLLGWTPTLSIPIYSSFAMSHVTVLNAGLHTIQIQAWVPAGDNVVSNNRGISVGIVDTISPATNGGWWNWLRDGLIWLGESGRFWLGIVILLLVLCAVCWVYLRDD